MAISIIHNIIKQNSSFSLRMSNFCMLYDTYCFLFFLLFYLQLLQEHAFFEWPARSRDLSPLCFIILKTNVYVNGPIVEMKWRIMTEFGLINADTYCW